MYVGVLGPLSVDVDGRAVTVAGARLRRLLTRLALDAGRTVSVGELVDAVWPDDPPVETANALQSLVSRLRRALGGSDTIAQIAQGYRLPLAPAQTDLHRFAELAGTGRQRLAVDPAGAELDLDRALDLWRGPPLVDADGAAYSVPVVARLEEQRSAALADRAEAAIALGRAAETVGRLEELTVAFPLRERFVVLLMRALDSDGRTAEALTAYDRYRTHLADELGSDPSPATQALHLALLRGTSTPAPVRPPARPTNLRTPLTSFVGREVEVDRVLSLLDGGRLVTVVGPGGAGKTRLSSEVGQRWRGRAPDGVWLVELASVSDGADIPQAALGALGIRDASLLERGSDRGGRDARSRLLDSLGDADCLLVLDNCEHLLESAAELVDALLAHAPRVRVLTTSREPLGVVGEALCTLPPLGLPPAGADVAQAAGYPAVELFVERASAVSAGFTLDAATVAAVVTVVRRLDGLPLALELAAARLRVLPVDVLADRLSDRFRLLTGGNRTALPRHRTLRAVVEWSWDLLTGPERLLAERLSVFPAGATGETAAAICADDRLAAGEIPELMVALADKSLLQVVDEAGLRFRMLETIREYGVERLAERGEAEAARRAHAAYFVALAERLDPVLRTGAQLSALAALRAERDNLIAAVRFLADAGDADLAYRLVAGLSWFWTLTGAEDEAMVSGEHVIRTLGDVAHPLRPFVHARVLLSELWTRGDPSVGPDQDASIAWADIGERLEAALDALDAAPPPPSESVLALRQILALFAGDPDRAERYGREALAHATPWLRAAVGATRAAMAENAGDLDSVRTEIDAAYADFRSVGDRWGMSQVLNNRGLIRTFDGDLAGATQDYLEAQRLVWELGSLDDTMMVALRLSELSARTGDIAAARAHLARARQEESDAPMPFDRTLVLGAAEVGLLLTENRVDEAVDQVRALRQRLDDPPTSRFVAGHLTAILLTASAMVDLRVGAVDEARRHLATAFAAGVPTRDFPIVAAVAMATASLAAATGQPERAARILGAAAALRGADDPTDPAVVDLSARLRTALGERYEGLYAEGRVLRGAEAIAAVDPALVP